MRRNVFWVLTALIGLASCNWGTVGFSFYPPTEPSGITAEPSARALGDLEVVGYLPAGKLLAFDPDRLGALTDLVYFTLGVRSDGSLATETLTDAHRDALLKARRDAGVRVLIGVTDHRRDGPLARVAADPGLRSRFASRLTSFLVAGGFDGADFDWEYPAGSSLDDYALLLRDVRTLFAPRGLRLSVAVSPSRPLTRDGFRAVDRVHAMLYDNSGRHSTLEAAARHVDTLLAAGVSPAQLVLGIPFYGRGTTASGPRWSDALSYRTIQDRWGPSSDQDTAGGYFFNGADTVRLKVRHAHHLGLAGVMIWEIGQDSTDETSLLSAITRERQRLTRAE